MSRFHLYAQTMRRQPPFVLGYDIAVENPRHVSRGVTLAELDGNHHLRIVLG